MSMEWSLLTPRIKTFKVITKTTKNREVAGVGEDGEPSIITVTDEIESISEVEAPADRVRLMAAANDKRAATFHIRLIYGRLGRDGAFEPAVRDDGIVIGGPNYHALDTNEDGQISEEELLRMSAEILKWDGELTTPLPVEGQA